VNEPEIIRTKAEARWKKRFNLKYRIKFTIYTVVLIVTLPLRALPEKTQDKIGDWFGWLDIDRLSKSDRVRWIDWTLAKFRSDPQRFERCNSILTAYPDDHDDVLSQVMSSLSRERDLLDQAIALDVAHFDVIDEYLFGQTSSGEYLGVPWDLLKFLDLNFTPSLRDFQAVKKRVIAAAPTTRKEFFQRAREILKDAEAQMNQAFKCPESQRTQEQLEIHESYSSESDREFQYDHPDYVVRIPGRPPILNKKEYWDYLGSLPKVTRAVDS